MLTMGTWNTQLDFLNASKGTPELQTVSCIPNKSASGTIVLHSQELYEPTPPDLCHSSSHSFPALIYPNSQFSFSLCRICTHSGQGAQQGHGFLSLLQHSRKDFIVFSKVLPNGSIMRVFILCLHWTYGRLLRKLLTRPQRKSHRLCGTKSFWSFL